MASAHLIFNPHAGRRNQEELLPEILRSLGRSGFRLETCRTGEPGEGTTLAREAVRNGAELVVAWGGDGTVNEVANGLVGTEVPLGVLPGGTVNLLALEFGIPGELSRACDLLVKPGKRRRIGVGRAGKRYFLLMAGFGLDAFLIRKVGAEWKPFLGRYSYLLGAFRYAWDYPFPPVFIQFDGKTLVGRQVVIANVCRYAGSYRLAPLADPSRGDLTLFLFQGRKVRNYVRYLWGIRSGHHSVYPDVLNFQWNCFRVLGGPEPVEMQLDGEYIGGESALEVEKVPDALTLICPG